MGFQYRGVKNNKEFMMMKKDMEERRWKSMRSKNSSGPVLEEYFVDQTRNVGVVAGEKDIKLDMKNKMSKYGKYLL